MMEGHALRTRNFAENDLLDTDSTRFSLDRSSLIITS